MINLRKVHITASRHKLNLILRALQPASYQLREISVECVLLPCLVSFLTLLNRSEGDPLDMPLSDFTRLSHISFRHDVTDVRRYHDLISANRHTLRSLTLRTTYSRFPPGALRLENLMHLNVRLHFNDLESFRDIFLATPSVESFSLSCYLEQMVFSPVLRAMKNPLPRVKHFAFNIHFATNTDLDLFPALAEILRGRTKLESLDLTVPDPAMRRFLGYDSSAWGLLHTLPNLTTLAMTYVDTLSAALTSWLVPRDVRFLYINSTALKGKCAVPFLTVSVFIRIGFFFVIDSHDRLGFAFHRSSVWDCHLACSTLESPSRGGR